MENTIADNQSLRLKEKVKDFYLTHMHPKGVECPIKNILATNLDKWGLLIIYNLSYYQVMRFNQLKKKVDGVSSRMLSITLKKLEKNGVVKRTIFPEVPPRVEYELTPFGKEFSTRVIDMSQWFLESYPRIEKPTN